MTNTPTVFYNSFDQARGFHGLIIKAGLLLGVVRKSGFVICLPSLRKANVGFCYGPQSTITPSVRSHEEVHVLQRMRMGLLSFVFSYLFSSEKRLLMEMEAYTTQYVKLWYAQDLRWEYTVTALPGLLVDLLADHKKVYRFARVPGYPEMRQTVIKEMNKVEYTWPR
jgi:hypothetical protein